MKKTINLIKMWWYSLSIQFALWLIGVAIFGILADAMFNAVKDIRNK